MSDGSMMKTVKPMSPSEYLAMPYHRYVLPEGDGTFRAEILEFPGCIATADTSSEALGALECVATSWLQSMIDRKQRVPDPIEASEFSGKLVLRLPKSLHKKAAHAAAIEGVSLNQFITSCVAEHVGERSSAKHSVQAVGAGPNLGLRQLASNSVVQFNPTSAAQKFIQSSV